MGVLLSGTFSSTCISRKPRGIESAPGLCLIEARRGAAPGLVIEPPLLLRGPDGAESEEIRRIYHR